MRFCVAAAVLLASSAICISQEKPDLAELKKQLADVETKAAELKKKIAEAEGEPTVFLDTRIISPGLMKIGQRGQLSNPNKFGGQIIEAHKVAKILGDDSFLLQADESDPALPLLLVKGYSTKGMADGQILPYNGFLLWRVVGTEEHQGRVLMVLRHEIKQPEKKPVPKKK